MKPTVENAARPDAIDIAIANVEARESQAGFAMSFIEPSGSLLDQQIPAKPKKRAGRIAGTIAAGTAGVAFLSSPGNIAPASAFEMPAIVTEGQMQSLSGVETALSVQESLIKLKEREEAAARYGWDAYSKNPLHWRINRFGGAELVPDPTGLIHRARTNGAVIDGWIKVDRPGSKIDALPIVVNSRGVPFIDLSGGTFWLFPQAEREAQFNKMVAVLRVKERKEQPGTNVMPICIPRVRDGDLLGVTETQLDKYASVAEAIQRLAVPGDPYTMNPANWEINQYGGAHLIEDLSGKVHTLKADKYTVVDSFIYVKRFEKAGPGKFNAIGLVQHPTPPNAIGHVELTGGTFYTAKPGFERRLFFQVLQQLKDREKREQPNTLVLPVCN